MSFWSANPKAPPVETDLQEGTPNSQRRQHFPEGRGPWRRPGLPTEATGALGGSSWTKAETMSQPLPGLQDRPVPARPWEGLHSQLGLPLRISRSPPSAQPARPCPPLPSVRPPQAGVREGGPLALSFPGPLRARLRGNTEEVPGPPYRRGDPGPPEASSPGPGGPGGSSPQGTSGSRSGWQREGPTKAPWAGPAGPPARSPEPRRRESNAH